MHCSGKPVNCYRQKSNVRFIIKRLKIFEDAIPVQWEPLGQIEIQKDEKVKEPDNLNKWENENRKIREEK